MAKDIVKRKWLNKLHYHSVAFIRTRIERPKVGWDWLDADIIIGDCSRQITLDFDVKRGDKSDLSNALYKLDTLINTLQEFRDMLAEFWEPDPVEEEENG